MASRRPIPQLNPNHPGMAVFESTSADRGLRAGDVIRTFDRSFHFIQYVNSSGAYAVPLASVTRVIAGQVAAFTAGGKTISAHSGVEIVNPLAMGGNSPEYARYAKMVRALEEGTEEGTGMAKAATPTGPAVVFGDWDNSDIEPIDLTGGHEVRSKSVTPANEGEEGMAKKAGKSAAKAKAPKAAKPTKTVRACACGCGTETTGHFAPGHDARLHGWISKLADGRIEPKDIPYPSTRAKLGLVKTQAGYRATKPHFYRD